jgi:hypothetical protein
MLGRPTGEVEMNCGIPKQMLLVPLLCVAGVATANGDDVEAIRSAFNFMHLAKVEVRMTITRTSQVRAEPSVIVSKVVCLRDGERWGCSERRASQSPNQFLVDNFYFRGDECVVFNWVSDAEGRRVPGEYLFSTFYSPSVAGSRFAIDSGWPDGNSNLICFGVMDAQFICSQEGLLGDATVENDADGLAVARGRSRFGNLTLWCDPAQRHLPVRMEMTQTPEHYYLGRRIAEIEMLGGNVIPAGKIHGIELTVETRFSQLESPEPRPYISGWTIVREDQCDGGVIVTHRTEAEVTSIELGVSPRGEDFLLGLDVPRWERVGVHEAEYLNYVWDGEWVVPNDETLVTARFEKTGVHWSLVVLATLGLVALTAGVWLFRKKSV